MRRVRASLLLAVALGLPTTALAAPQDRMTITGDRELPSVLYVVPWRAPTQESMPAPMLENPLLAPLGPCATGPEIKRFPGCGEEPAGDDREK